ncbi:exonuclease III [Pelobates cultripes]|uniref:Exonuclease III n=1 Tax=Pelobates cultripes TaxID=61616 RepID=A0AAD1S344_PELCU|nr:exonuclease III [Pelobates cultripes]
MRHLLRTLWSQKTSIAFIQETHLKGKDAPKIRDRRFPQGFYATNSEVKRTGVAIIFAHSVPFLSSASQADPLGRFLFVKGMIAEHRYTFATIYCPNKGQHRFLAKALTQLERFRDGTLVLAGDLNIPLDPRRDSSAGTSTIPPALYKESKTGIKHDSDHAPVQVTLKSPLFNPRELQWRLNESVLTDTNFTTQITQTLTQYFADNDSPAIAPLTVWEAQKCVILGQLIILCTQWKRQHAANIVDLTHTIADLKTRHKRDQTDDTYLLLTDKRRQLRDLLSQKLLHTIWKSNRHFYEFSNKCWRTLARTLQQKQRQHHIHQVKGRDGTMKRALADILQAFRHFSRSYITSTPPHDERRHHNTYTV